MKTIIKMNDEIIGDVNMNMKVFNDCDISEIYNTACKLKPNNDWNDLICQNIIYFDDHIEIQLIDRKEICVDT